MIAICVFLRIKEAIGRERAIFGGELRYRLVALSVPSIDIDGP